MTDSSRWKATVFVGGLAPAVTSNESANATDPHRGFAYVEFEDPDDAKEAIDNMDQSELFGRVIKVSAAKLPKSKDEGLGSRTALWAQEGWLAENAVSKEDRLVATQTEAADNSRPDDPMQGLEGLDVAGPKPE
ncbi:hypothetical protein P8C59_000254 [Phyllachora maydis]|uniref:RRM domain-containing protein n=1 Tax=Phyllachora maydis TaxID=1825666 RepID=A0AAD9HWV3_9PEZI|nr:hypothetical protein P8C59_000254 [Phyllachora maydis]